MKTRDWYVTLLLSTPFFREMHVTDAVELLEGILLISNIVLKYKHRSFIVF